jgi:hypothetical protein
LKKQIQDNGIELLVQNTKTGNIKETLNVKPDDVTMNKIFKAD